MKSTWTNLALAFGITWCSFSLIARADDLLYSQAGLEMVVEFTAVFQSDYAKVSDITILDASQKQDLIESNIKPLMKYLFGPLTNHEWGSIKEILSIEVDWNNATIKKKKVYLPYKYKAVWLIEESKAILPTLKMPVPFSTKLALTKKWKKCTDSNPEHQTESFYWYFWDPTRFGCDNKLNVNYQEVDVVLKSQSVETTYSTPEYDRMINGKNHKNELTMTFAFGYYEDQPKPNPATDTDDGVEAYRDFVDQVLKVVPVSAVSEDITLADYKVSDDNAKLVIGKKISFVKNGVKIVMKLVVNAGIDQMMLFAKSFAHDHDSFFAWLGHSRVGNGFDAQNFGYIMQADPEYYSLTSDYQLIYWGGCNSYSYYTLPFFKMKAAQNPTDDPNGTKNLDITANGLPSFFALNTQNAMIYVNALLNFDRKTTYQSIVNQAEMNASGMGAHVLSVVMGDEDNPGSK